MFSESGFSKNVHSSQGKCHAGNELILKICVIKVTSQRTQNQSIKILPLCDVPQCHEHEENN